MREAREREREIERGGRGNAQGPSKEGVPSFLMLFLGHIQLCQRHVIASETTASDTTEYMGTYACVCCVWGGVCVKGREGPKHRKRGEKSSFLPFFLAPEVLSGSEPSEAADWWAVGVITYQLLVGKVGIKRLSVCLISCYSGSVCSCALHVRWFACISVSLLLYLCLTLSYLHRVHLPPLQCTKSLTRFSLSRCLTLALSHTTQRIFCRRCMHKFTPSRIVFTYHGCLLFSFSGFSLLFFFPSCCKRIPLLVPSLCAIICAIILFSLCLRETGKTSRGKVSSHHYDPLPCR